MLKRTYRMASKKFLNNPWSRKLLTGNIPRILICLFVIQLQLSRVDCSTQVSPSNKPNEVKHYILVHGGGHGAWCWFKVIPFLESAGHNVTAIDLSASGIDTREIQDLRSFYDYSEPLLELLDSLPSGEKVTLVGHSFGGFSLALAMELYPNKISLAVFVAAFLPDTTHRPSYVYETFLERINATEIFLDTLFYNVTRRYQPPLEVLLWGPNALKYSLYHLSRREDVELAKLLVRPISAFLDDLSARNNFTEEGFGSVEKAYIKSPEDRTIPGEFQSWMIENAGVKKVREVENADHMAMISRPRELSDLLLEECWNMV